MNLDTLAEELGLDSDEFFEIAELYVETCAADFYQLQSAIKAANAELIAGAAHSIKGASGNLGFVKAYEAAGRIETRARDGSLAGIAQKADELKKELDQVKILVEK